MKKINLIIAVAALAAIMAGMLLSVDERSTGLESEAIFPDLQAHIEQVDNLTIETATGSLLDAQKVDGEWVDSNQGNYPLNADEIIRLLNNLLQAQLDSAKTAKPENFSRLGVQDIVEQDSEASLLTLSAAEKRWSLLVGNNASSGSGVFVRKPQEQQSWLTKADISLPVDKSDWLYKQILDIAPESVSEISRVDHWRFVPVNVAPEEDQKVMSDWQLADIEEGRELQYDSIIDSAAQSILNLSFDALAHKRPHELSPDSLQTTVNITTKSGEQVTLKLFQQDETVLLIADSEQLDGYWEQWVYELSSFNAGRLTKTKEDFLQALPSEEEQEKAPPVN